MKNLLLTGASGFLGWNICSIKQDQWRIHGIIHRHEISIQGGIVYRVDLTDATSVQFLFDQLKPGGVIHTAAISDANYCQEHPKESSKINMGASVQLAQLCGRENIPFVFISSDLVFDGKKGNYTETDEINPVSIYGEQKAKAEQEILKVYPAAAICRMPLMLGNAGTVATSYLQHFITQIKEGIPQKLFVDEFRSPLGGNSAAKALFLALESFKGIFHLGGPERLSRFELGSLFADIFNLEKSLIIPGKQSDVKMSAPRPRDVSMDSSKAGRMGFTPLRLEQELQNYFKEYSI